MSDVISKVSRLKPEIRLAQAVSHFEADLSSEQKNVFRFYRSQSLQSPPDTSDVMRLTAEIDRQASGKVGGRCFGPRFTSFLHVAQQFAALGDVIVGGSQNIIACGVWALLRMSLLTIVNFSSYLEKLSTLFMHVGRSASRYQTMALLYPRSKDLQSHLSEYFIVAVRLCHQFLKYTKQSAFRQIASTLGESDIKLFQSEFDYWANSIKEEINLLMAMTIKEESQENSRARSLSNRLFKSVSRQQEMVTNLRVLDLCSTFDHETAWKQTRKVGNTTHFRQVIEYQHWKDEGHSRTLVYTGKLGSGKSVLMANVVDDLNIYVQNKMTPVAYFFCKHDISESLKARTIIGSLARQLLRTMPDLAVVAQLCDKTALDIEAILNVLRRALPPNHRAYFVLDGLDECDPSEKEILSQHLQKLQEVLTLLLCVSYRVEPSNALELSFDQYIEPSFASIPDDNPEIEAYVDAELKNCLESKKLVTGEATLKEEIQDALLRGAQGMFLWVALQIQSLCAMKTDIAIRDALADLPKNLSETFSRILRKSGESEKSYQRSILQLTAAANRPLAVGELREALSVTPGDAMWNPSNLLNDVHAALACCGCLLVVDEEESTIRFVHHSVKQFLLRDSDSDVSNKIAFTIDSARRTMADIVVTYLSYGVFGTEVSTTRVPPMAIGSASSKIVSSTLGSSGYAQNLALKFLKPKKQPDMDISRILAEARRPFRSRGEDEFKFFSYAKSCWLQNIFYASGENQFIHDFLLTLIEKRVLNADLFNEVDWTPLERVHEWHYSIGKALLDSSQVNVNSKDTQGKTLLARMAQNGYQVMVELLLAIEKVDVNSKDQDGMTPLAWAARNKHKSTIIMFLNHSKVDVDWVSYYEIDSLSWTQVQYLTVTRSLFGTSKVDVNLKDLKGRTPLWRAIAKRDPNLTRILLETNTIDANLADFDHITPLSHAICDGDQATVKLLLEADKVDVSYARLNQPTPLLHAIKRGNLAMLKLLLENDRVDVNLKGGIDQLTPLFRLIERPNVAMLKPLLEDDRVDVNLKGGIDQLTPLLHAIKRGNLATLKLLLENGRVDVNLKGGVTQLTPLLYLIERGNFGILKLLLEDDRVDVNLKGGIDQLTPLLHAIEGGNFSTLKLLLETGKVNVNLKGGVDQRTPLSQSIETGRFAMFELLLETGQVDVNLMADRLTPLSRAARLGRDAMVELLLEIDNIAINSTDLREWNPLFWAVRGGHEAIVQMLLKTNKIDVNSRDWALRTSLYLAAEHAFTKIVKLLLENDKIDVNLGDINKETPLFRAVNRGHREIVSMLLEHEKIDVNSSNLSLVTPMTRAIWNGDKLMVDLLLTKNHIHIDFGDYAHAGDLGHEEIIRSLIDARVNQLRKPTGKGGLDFHRPFSSLLLSSATDSPPQTLGLTEATDSLAGRTDALTP